MPRYRVQAGLKRCLSGRNLAGLLVLLAVLSSACQRATPPFQPAPETVLPGSTQALLEPQTAEVTPSQPPTVLATPTSEPTPTSGPIPVPNLQSARTQTSGEADGALAKPLIGVETHSLDSILLQRMDEAQVDIMRRNALLWGLVEPVEGQRNWGEVASLEDDLKQAAEQGVDVILIIRFTPAWAQQVEGFSCGPVRPDKLDAFAAFVRDAVIRYSAPPFNVRYWEIGNEPDVESEIMTPDSAYGCWGDPGLPYFGGEYYAEALKDVYPVIKEVNPNVQLFIGGLLLDCDPAKPPEGKTCASAKFFEGILRNGGGDYFDIVSYHGYGVFVREDRYGDMLQAWEHRGGVVTGKADFLRETMNQFGLDKPLFLTESGLLCPEWAAACQPPSSFFYEAQAEYMVRLIVQSWAAEISGLIWYGLEGPGWRAGGLLERGGGEKPVFKALKFFQQKMAGARFVDELSGGPGLFGYEFSLGERLMWVLWSGDANTYAITLPGFVQAVYDKYGEPIPVGTGTVEVKSPIYVEISP